MTVHLLQIPLLPACSLGCYGEQRFATPCFDALAAQSTVCNQYYSNDALAVHSSDSLTVHRWSAPEPELDLLLKAAECWFSAEQWRQLLSTASHESSAGSQERLWEVCPPSLRATVEATAIALAYDDALGEWVEGMSFSPDDILIVVGESGDKRRRPESQPAWLGDVSESMVHLPLLIHQIGQQEHQRIEELISTRELSLVVNQLATCQTQDDRTDLNSILTQLQADEIHWRLPACQAIRTKDWLMAERQGRALEDVDHTDVALFRKPEDLWDLLNVASQHPEFVERSINRFHSADS